jgi:hypothetical protein
LENGFLERFQRALWNTGKSDTALGNYFGENVMCKYIQSY